MGKNNDVTFRFFSAHTTLLSRKTKIVSVITEMRLRTSDEQCLSTEFDCDDLYCINSSLVCNGNFNCERLIDEKSDCERDQKESVLEFLTTNSNIVIMTIGCGLLFGMCFSMCWNCVRKLREDFREKEENIRRSREDGLEQPGLTLSRSRGTLDEGGCYVPSLELKPPFMTSPRHHNGGVGIIREDTIDTDVDTLEQGCQTGFVSTIAASAAVSGREPRRCRSRESCASDTSTPPPPPPTTSCPHGPPISPYPEDHYRRRRAQETPLPPPPPPPPDPAGLYGGSLHCDMHRPRRVLAKARSVPAHHNFDDDDGEDLGAEGSSSGPTTPRRYRAEAVIELSSRPVSMASARSAPDVVVKI